METIVFWDVASCSLVAVHRSRIAETSVKRMPHLTAQYLGRQSSPTHDSVFNRKFGSADNLRSVYMCLPPMQVAQRSPMFANKLLRRTIECKKEKAKKKKKVQRKPQFLYTPYTIRFIKLRGIRRDAIRTGGHQKCTKTFNRVIWRERMR
jgi:hypothetical protein